MPSRRQHRLFHHGGPVDSLPGLPAGAQAFSVCRRAGRRPPRPGGLQTPGDAPRLRHAGTVARNHQGLPNTAFDPLVQHRLAASVQASVSTSMDLFSNLTYVPSLWDQGQCGSCWVFASTAMLEVALSHTYGIKDFLSTQFLQSNARYLHLHRREPDPLRRLLQLEEDPGPMVEPPRGVP